MPGRNQISLPTSITGTREVRQAIRQLEKFDEQLTRCWAGW